MGFAAGFFGGITLTTSVLYLTLAIHQRNRLQQAYLLRQQALVLTSFVDPPPPPPPPRAREVRLSWAETAKDRWNAEIEGLMRRVENMDWDAARTSLEDKVASIWAKAMQRTREEVPDTNS